MIKIKVCGIRAPSHALVAARAGADFIGMLFAPSPRRVSIEEAQAVADAVRGIGAGRPKLVGVFVNATAEEVHETGARVGLDMAQLSGDEDEAHIARVRLPVIKAVHVEADSERAAGTELRRRLATLRSLGALPLLDAKVHGQFGGTGRAFDWENAMGLAEEYDFLLAGGLTPEGVGRAIAQVRPWGVDVSSGVETGGVKDEAKIRAFIQAARKSQA